MITFIGLAAAVLLIGAVALIFFLTGNRGRREDRAAQQRAVAGGSPHAADRASGRGED